MWNKSRSLLGTAAGFFLALGWSFALFSMITAGRVACGAALDSVKCVVVTTGNMSEALPKFAGDTCRDEHASIFWLVPVSVATVAYVMLIMMSFEKTLIHFITSRAASENVGQLIFAVCAVLMWMLSIFLTMFIVADESVSKQTTMYIIFQPFLVGVAIIAGTLANSFTSELPLSDDPEL